MTANAIARDKPAPDGRALWSPDTARSQNSLMARFARQVGQPADHPALWQWSVDHPETFWSALWDFCAVIGDKGETVIAPAARMQDRRFFPEASLNYAENLLRRRDDAPAIIFRDETGRERALSHAELFRAVGRWARAFRAAGVGQGDRVAGLLPNMPETIIAMAAAASIGAIWASASPDFGAQGVIDRFGQIEPTLLITVDSYSYNGKVISLFDKLREIAAGLPSVTATIVIPFIQAGDDLSAIPGAIAPDQFLGPLTDAGPDFVRVPFDHPLVIMFSSGTTGIPKCIVHGHGGVLLQHLKEHRLHCDVRPDDRIFYFTTCGWMMWNWLVSGLASGATLLLYDGSPFLDQGDVLWSFTSDHGCSLFGTGAKYIDALKSANLRPGERHDLSALRTLTSTGSPLVHESFDYVYDAIKPDLHLASISGGTDIVSCFVLGNPLSPVWRGEIQGAGLGLAVDIFDEQGQSLPPGAGSGELVCTAPFPSMPVGFWNDADGAKYHQAYFARFDNVWCHGDWIARTDHGGFIIHGRSDATLNPGGVRIGTAEIYRQVEQLPEVVESIAVGQDWKGDVRVILFVRLRDDVRLDDGLADRLRRQIRAGASPRHVPAKIIQVADIPRTRSGKITELAVRDVIHGRSVRNSEALANPESLDLYRAIQALQSD